MVKVSIFIGIVILQALEAFILIRGLKLPARVTPWIIAVFVVFNLALPYLIWLWSGARQPPTWAAIWIVRPVFAWHFNWFCFLVFLAPLILALSLASSWGGFGWALTAARIVVLGSIGLWTALTIFGLSQENDIPQVVKLEVLLPNLAEQEDGIRLVQLSDPHVAWWNSREEICRIGAMIRDLSPDLLVITGDMVDHNPDYVDALAQCLTDVRPRLGRYAIIGNHDVYTGREAVARRMEERGLKMIRNGWISLETRGSSVVLVGVDDSGRNWTGPDPSVTEIPQALVGMPPGRPVILLKHRPIIFEDVAGLPIGLILAGHTHGGQICLPFGDVGLADLKWPYAFGLSHDGEKTQYVSRGTGTVGWPFRLWCPADISLITLRSPKAAGR
jgi:hypothetical protein